MRSTAPPAEPSAFATAFATAAGALAMPPSPAPFTPSGLSFATLSMAMVSIGGSSEIVGIA